MTTKICTYCGETHPATTFYFHKQKSGQYGVTTQCRKCLAGKILIKRGKFDQGFVDSFWDRLHQEERQKEALSNGRKICSRCDEEKNLDEFHNRKNGRAGKVELCKSCQQKAGKEHYDKNCETIKHHVMKAYFASHEEGKERQRKYYFANKGKFKNYQKKYADSNKKFILDYKKVHYEKNRDKYLSYGATRRSREKNGNGFTVEQVTKLYATQKGKCKICNVQLNGKFHRDHIVPLALGGINQIENIQLLCPPCNWSKGARHPEEFMKSVMRGGSRG